MFVLNIAAHCSGTCWNWGIWLKPAGMKDFSLFLTTLVLIYLISHAVLCVSVQGVFDGVTGIVRKPLEGAQEEGAKGFFKGNYSIQGVQHFQGTVVLSFDI